LLDLKTPAETGQYACFLGPSEQVPPKTLRPPVWAGFGRSMKEFDTHEP
jgi:hypothetical protein